MLYLLRMDVTGFISDSNDEGTSRISPHAQAWRVCHVWGSGGWYLEVLWVFYYTRWSLLAIIEACDEVTYEKQCVRKILEDGLK